MEIKILWVVVMVKTTICLLGTKERMKEKGQSIFLSKYLIQPAVFEFRLEYFSRMIL